MATAEQPTVTLSEYIDLNYVECLFGFCDEVSSIEEFCTAAEGVIKYLRGLDAAGWRYERNGNDPHWFILSHSDREEAIRVLGIDYVLEEEKQAMEDEE